MPKEIFQQSLSWSSTRLQAVISENQEQWSRLLERHPSSLSVYVNRTCNLACLHCDLPRRCLKAWQPETAVPWDAIVDKFAHDGGKTVSLVGREPLMTPQSRDDVRTLMRAARRHGLRFGMVNNGTYFRRFVEETPDLNLDYVDFSVEGVGWMHESIRLGSMFTVVEDALLLARSLIDEVNIATTVTSMNHRALGDLIDYFSAKGEFSHVFHTFIPHQAKGFLDPLCINVQTWRNAVFPTLKKAAKQGKNILIEAFADSFTNPDDFLEALGGGQYVFNDDGLLGLHEDMAISLVDETLGLLTTVLVDADGELTTMRRLIHDIPDSGSLSYLSLPNGSNPYRDLITQLTHRLPAG